MYQSPLNFKCIFDSLLLIAVCSVQLGMFIIRHCTTPLSQELQKAVHPGPLFVFLKGVCCTFFFLAEVQAVLSHFAAQQSHIAVCSANGWLV